MSTALSAGSASAQAPAAPIWGEKPSKQRWVSLSAISLAMVVDNTDGGLVNTLFPVIRAALGLDLGALGVLTSISRFARMIFAPLWAMAADKWGRKRVLFIVTGLWGIWTAAAGFAQNLEQLLILYTIGVIGTVAGEPIASAMTGDLFEEDERGKAFGMLRTIVSLGALVLTPLLGQLSRVPDGWRWGMFIMGGVSLLSGFIILLLVKEPESVKAGSKEGHGSFKLSQVGKLLKIPTVWLLAGMLPFVTSLVLLAFFVTYYVDVRGWQTADAAMLFTVFMGGWAISSLVGGLVGDWFDKRFGPKGRIALMQIYLVVFAAFSYLAMQMDWGHGATLYLIVFLFGLVGSIGFSGVVLPMVSAVVPPQLSATAFALLFSLVQGLISALLSLALGYLAKSYGLQNVMFWLVTVPYLVNAVYWFLFYPFYPRDVAAQPERTAELTAE